MEIQFKRDTSFRKQFFVPDSFAHPAKMDAQLLIWLTENYSEVGETILDPMAGSGTMMLACTLGRNVVLVELEDKFCKMLADNWAEVKMRPQLGSQMGDCRIIQGDARNLEGLLADKIITSPPYAESNTTGRPDTYNGSRGPHSQVQLSDYRQSKDNIGNLPYGDIDKIITSPPYTNRMDGGMKDAPGMLYTEEPKDSWYTTRDPQNVGNLPYGNIDKIITIPPYENVDKIGREHGGIVERESVKGTTGNLGIAQIYSRDKNNIGNLKGDTYLEAMLQVYSQCFTVLKDGGLLILVTKNFIRNRQVIRLDTDTIKLCEQAGFSFVDRHFRKLPAQSFWRTIYQQKYPDVEVIQNEDILIFSKLIVG